MKSVEFANYVLNVSKDMNIRLNVEQLQMVMFMVYVEYYYKYDSCLFMDHWISENRRLHIEHVWYMFCGYGMTEICPFLEREAPTLSTEVESMCRFYIKEIKKLLLRQMEMCLIEVFPQIIVSFGRKRYSPKEINRLIKLELSEEQQFLKRFRADLKELIAEIKSKNNLPEIKIEG
jgi:hypothetical protein